jgi:hypothetical protein
MTALKSGGVAVTQLKLSLPETATAGATAESTGYSSSSSAEVEASHIEVCLVRMLNVFDSSNSSSSSITSNEHAATAVTAAVTAAAVSDVTVTHLSCDLVTPDCYTGAYWRQNCLYVGCRNR